MADASLQFSPPHDRYKLIYWNFLLHGIGILLPWNMFINAGGYFISFKLAGTVYALNFMTYLTFAAQTPNFLFQWLNIFVRMGGSITKRLVVGIVVVMIIFVVTVVLAMVDTDDWKDLFFALTIISAVVANAANGVYQNTIFGMAAKFPQQYSGAVVLGSNISGTFCSVVYILAQRFASNPRTMATYFFLTALFVLCCCFDSYFALPLNPYYRYHQLKEKKEIKRKAAESTASGEAPQAVPYGYIMSKIWPQVFNVFMTFFITLSMFPNLQSAVKPNNESSLPSFLAGDYWLSVGCFLNFNLFAMIGSMFTSWFTWPGPRFLWIPVVLRIVFVPFFLLSNYLPGDRSWPVLITDDWVYITVCSVMGITHGYLSSLGMMYAPNAVEPEYAGVAGQFGAAALISGLFFGIAFGFIWPTMVRLTL